MDIERKIAHAPAVTALRAELSQCAAPCIGCDRCRGICAALLELLSLPEIVLGRDRAA